MQNKRLKRFEAVFALPEQKHTNHAHAISSGPSAEIERTIPSDVSGEAAIRVLRFCCCLQLGLQSHTT